MTIALRSLVRGDRLPELAVRIDAADVRAYLEATGEAASASAALWGDTMPPLALGAFALAALLEQVPVVAGTLHTGQELAFRRAVVIGEPLTARISVAQRAERAGTVLIALDLELHAPDGVVASGRITIVYPASEGA